MARRQAPGTRERILAVAARLFSRHGVRAVGMQQLVDETGLGKSLVYREFASKDDLVAAWLRDNDQAWVKLADAATAPYEGDPARQLLALVEFVYDSVGPTSSTAAPSTARSASSGSRPIPAGRPRSSTWTACARCCGATAARRAPRIRRPWPTPCCWSSVAR